jgi:hypothetical protein
MVKSKTDGKQQREHNGREQIHDIMLNTQQFEISHDFLSSLSINTVWSFWPGSYQLATLVSQDKLNPKHEYQNPKQYPIT